MKNTAYASQTLTRISQGLYKTGAGQYFGRIKRNGKIHKKSLKTEDFQIAKRSLKTFEKEVEIKQNQLPDLLFQDFTTQWLEVIKTHLKDSTYRRRQVSVNQLLPSFKGYKLREIRHERLEKWANARSKVAAQTFNLDRETLMTIFNYAIKLNIVSMNPVAGIPKRKSMKVVIVPPTREQFKELLAVMRENKHDSTKESPPYAYPVDSGYVSGKLTGWRGQLFLKP